MNPIVEQINSLRKSGKLPEAYVLAEDVLSENPDDISVQRILGWVIYDLIKDEIASFKAGEVDSVDFFGKLDERMQVYKNLKRLERPGMLHSRILGLVLKVSREWPSFLEFAKWWGVTNFRKEDLKPVQTINGKSRSSLRVKYLYAISRSVIGFRGSHTLRTWAVDQLDLGLKEKPDDIWLNYYRAKVYIEEGKNEKARFHLGVVGRKKKNESWIWSVLGRTYEEKEPEKAEICYYNAIRLAPRQREVINTRIRLAKLLAQQGRYPEARLQVKSALATGETFGWKISSDIEKLVASDWFEKEENDEKSLREPDVGEKARAILRNLGLERPVEKLGVIDGHMDKKSVAHVAISPTEGIVINYKDFPIVKDLLPGTVVLVSIIEETGVPYSVETVDKKSLPGFFETFEGELLHREGQKFAFLKPRKGRRIFIPGYVLGDLDYKTGDWLSCRAIMAEDRKHSRVGWKALSIEKIEDWDELG